MTGRAVIHDAEMTKGSRYKARGLVAHAAIGEGWHMVGAFSYGGIIIVTRRTVINDTRSVVIKLGTGKRRGVMAHRAILYGG